MSRQDRPPPGFPSPAQAPYEPLRRQPRPQRPRPLLCPPRAAGVCEDVCGFGGCRCHHPLHPEATQPRPLQEELRVFTAAGTVLPGRSRPRVGAGGRRRRGCSCRRSCGKAGWAQNHPVPRPGRLRRLGSIFCSRGGHAVGLTHGFKNAQAGTFRPTPRLSLCGRGFLKGCWGAAVWLLGKSWCGSNPRPPAPPPPPARGWVPSPPPCSLL